MRNDFQSKRWKGGIIVCCILLFFLLVSQFVAALWFNKALPQSNKSLSVQIGTWGHGDDDLDPDVNKFNEIVNAIRAADPLLQMNRTSLHILGANNGDNAPRPPNAVTPLDVIVWKRQDGTIAVAQVTGLLPGNVFDSWDSVESALNNAAVALTGQERSFHFGSVYTRAHAPVSYGGRHFLPRHDTVTGVPAIGSDWFLLNDTWVNQAYPIGSLIAHGGHHYRKISAADAEPGTNINIWREVPAFESDTDIATWYQREWAHGAIVVHEGNFYISTQSNNHAEPGLEESGWVLIPRHDPEFTVPEFVEGIHYAVNDLVRVGNGDDALFFLKMVDWASPHPIGDTSGAWMLIHEWKQMANVQRWSPDILYGNDFVGLIVEHNGQTFEKLDGWADMGIEPQAQPMVWRRILRWSESLRPAEHMPGDHPANRIFRLTNGGSERFFATAQPVFSWFQEPIDIANPYYRPVEAWNPEQEYSVLGYDVWTVSRRYHAYTIDENGNRIFWVLQNSPTGNSGTVTGEIPNGDPHDFIADDSASPYWRQIRFINREHVTSTIVGGNLVIWDRNPAKPIDDTNPIREPSALHNDWIRRTTYVSVLAVHTNYNGEVTLWQRTGEGATSQEPGFGNDWMPVAFRTGIEYVYTVNASGNISFWYSPTQSSSRPGSAGWINLDLPAVEMPDYIYVADGERVTYFVTDRGERWFALSPAWIGGSNQMQYRWNENNDYRSGDIVVFGITTTNTYRYFKMRAYVNTTYATGLSPMSPQGRLFWEPISVFAW